MRRTMKARTLAVVMTWGLLGIALALPGLLSVPSRAAPSDALTVCAAGPPDCQYTSIQAAVDAASDGDVIKVASGTYTGINNYGGLAQVVYVSKTVTIRGGYAAPGFADPPDPEANPSTLDAQGRGRVLYIAGNTQPTIEGLRLTGGEADGLGGGPLGDAGGGVYILTAAATIRNNQVIGNSASQGGGLVLHASDATLCGNTVSGNDASVGGGLLLEKSDATLCENDISLNTALEGGGLFLDGSDAILDGNTISANTASEYGGGGLSLYGSDALLKGNIISGNSASFGGGAFFMYSEATLEANVISGNSATRGGGLLAYLSNSTLTNSILADNQVNVKGGGLLVEDSMLSLAYSTFARNLGGDGSGIYLAYNGTVSLTNTILVSQTVGVTGTAGTTARLEATLWGKGVWANGTDWAGAGRILTGALNVWGDPAFVNPGSGDYHIGPGSAAIDAGVDAGVTTDIDGQARPGSSGYDLGADELYFSFYLPLVFKN